MQEVIIKDKKPSLSAEKVAAARAIESEKPEHERVCYDPYAKDFLGTKLAILCKSLLLKKIALWQAEKRVPGAVGCIAGRTRYIDEYLKVCLDDGIEQLVILGAGYDTRAYRFHELKGKVKVFEVDRPATQKVKMKKVKKIFGSLPDNVIYLSIDFEEEKLDKRLFEAGYDRSLKTLFIWEGVTMYITDEAVDETLSFVAKHSGRGSSIIFNYIFQSVVDGTCELDGAKEIAKDYKRRGEPLTFGIKKGTIDEFLSKRGFNEVKNVTGEYFKSNYFKGKNQRRNVCCLCGFVHAKVNPDEQG